MHATQGKHIPFPKDREIPEHPGGLQWQQCPSRGRGPSHHVPTQDPGQPSPCHPLTVWFMAFFRGRAKVWFRNAVASHGYGLEAGGGAQAPLPERAEKWPGIGKRF